jgi:hypothetical protein
MTSYRDCTHCGPSFGTRYFNSTHEIPLLLSQSHTSVPSRSMARTRYPPPGNTTTAAPVLRPLGEYTVKVGTET